MTPLPRDAHSRACHPRHARVICFKRVSGLEIFCPLTKPLERSHFAFHDQIFGAVSFLQIEEMICTMSGCVSSVVEYATKVCTEDGQWFRHPETNDTWTNYTMCHMKPEGVNDRTIHGIGGSNNHGSD